MIRQDMYSNYIFIYKYAIPLIVAPLAFFLNIRYLIPIKLWQMEIHWPGVNDFFLELENF